MGAPVSVLGLRYIHRYCHLAPRCQWRGAWHCIRLQYLHHLSNQLLIAGCAVCCSLQSCWLRCESTGFRCCQVSISSCRSSACLHHGRKDLFVCDWHHVLLDGSWCMLRDPFQLVEQRFVVGRKIEDILTDRMQNACSKGDLRLTIFDKEQRERYPAS